MSNFNKSIDTYQNTFELLVAMSKATISFAREYKYTFWTRIINYSLDATAEVFLAKDCFWTDEKILHINNALRNLALLQVVWKACSELPNISINVYTSQIDNIVTINRELRAWRDYCKRSTKN